MVLIVLDVAAVAAAVAAAVSSMMRLCRASKWTPVIEAVVAYFSLRALFCACSGARNSRPNIEEQQQQQHWQSQPANQAARSSPTLPLRRDAAKRSDRVRAAARADKSDARARARALSRSYRCSAQQRAVKRSRLLDCDHNQLVDRQQVASNTQTHLRSNTQAESMQGTQQLQIMHAQKRKHAHVYATLARLILAGLLVYMTLISIEAAPTETSTAYVADSTTTTTMSTSTIAQPTQNAQDSHNDTYPAAVIAPLAAVDEEPMSGDLGETIDKRYSDSLELLIAQQQHSADLSLNRAEDAGLIEQDNDATRRDTSVVIQRSPKIRRHASHIQDANWWLHISPQKQHSKKTPQTPAEQAFIGAPEVNKQQTHKTEKSPPRKPTVKTAHKAHEPVAADSSTSPKVGKKTKASEYEPLAKGPVYKYQPANQNAIVTIRYQLKSIRERHKLLVTRSVRQLHTLDLKLIDAYKSLLKRKQPLYAGMLYRTREFLNRMARDVKHERNVLEAMASRVHSVLRQRMTNRTLVKEYNQIVAKERDASSSPLKNILVPIKLSDDLPQANKTSRGQSTTTPSAPTTYDESPNIMKEVEDLLEPITLDPLSLLFSTTKGPRVNKRRNAATSKALQPNSTDASSTTTKRPYKPVIRFVSKINEIALKNELTKSQDLIVRIDRSSRELSDTVDDIMYLFKITTLDRKTPFGNKYLKQHQQTQLIQQELNNVQEIMLNSNDPKRALHKKNLKSPIRNFIEKYGKLTMANLDAAIRSSANLTANSPTASYSPEATSTTTAFAEPPTPSLPDIKPIFDPSALAYVEPVDVDTGFDFEVNT